MKILALETSGLTGSVALWENRGNSEPTQWNLPTDTRSARSLAPTIQRALAEFGWKPTDIDLVAVTNGPGSFTGVRVGVVTAKMFAFSVGCRAIGINTLQVIASNGLENITDGQATITAVLDAQRGELYVAKVGWNLFKHPTPWYFAEPTHVTAADQWIAELQPEEIVIGPGLERLVATLPSHVRVVDASQWQPQAASLATVSHNESACYTDEALNPVLLMPQYFRRTAAEEQFDKRHGL